MRGICSDCCDQAVVESIEQLAIGEGPYYDRWRERTAEGMRRYLDKLDA